MCKQRIPHLKLVVIYIIANLPGCEQLSVLQSSYIVYDPEQDPPLLSVTVLYLVYFCRPPSQVLEHNPLVFQSDH